MKETKTIVFSHSLRGWGEQNKVTEEFEFDIEATEEEINKEFADWVWQQVMDHCTWYEKE